jgi:hypothetical protein
MLNLEQAKAQVQNLIGDTNQKMFIKKIGLLLEEIYKNNMHTKNISLKPVELDDFYLEIDIASENSDKNIVLGTSFGMFNLYQKNAAIGSSIIASAYYDEKVQQSIQCIKSYLCDFFSDEIYKAYTANGVITEHNTLFEALSSHLSITAPCIVSLSHKLIECNDTQIFINPNSLKTKLNMIAPFFYDEEVLSLSVSNLNASQKILIDYLLGYVNSFKKQVTIIKKDGF